MTTNNDSVLTGHSVTVQQANQSDDGTQPETGDDRQIEDETAPPTPKRPSDGDDLESQPGYELPLDQVFEILKNSRRRETLQYLHRNDGKTTLSEVAEHIAAIENDTTVQAISSTQRKRVYVGLYQCHLPKMDDTDVVDFDQNRGTIELGPNADQLDQYLDQPTQPGWHRLYLSIAVGAVVLFAAGQAGGASYGLTTSVVLVALLTGITVCGIVHAVTAE